MENKYKIIFSCLLVLGLIGIATAQFTTYNRGSVEINKDGTMIIEVDGLTSMLNVLENANGQEAKEVIQRIS